MKNEKENGRPGDAKTEAIDEMASVLYNSDKLNCEIVDSVKIANVLYDAGYRKRSKGEAIETVKNCPEMR